jgi:hypothetical protein
MTSTMRFDKWENSLGQPYGSVIQVVQGTWGTGTTTTSGSYTDTGLSAAITPKFSNSKVLVLVNQAGCYKTGNDTTLQLRLLRDSTTLYWFESSGGWTGTTATNQFGTTSTSHLDSPATTSQVTYKTQMAAFSANGGTVGVQTSVGNGFPRSTITLLEIAQ